MESGAVFSDDRVYRYFLYRRWNVYLPVVNFIGLNPSTADEEQDDPTIRRCIAFARDWGYGAVWMTNLYAFRSTDPKVLRWMRLEEANGSENDHHLARRGNAADLVIVAWGAHGLQRRNRARDVLRLLYGKTLHCLRVTKGGHPSHPLYLPKNLTPTLYRGSSNVVSQDVGHA